MGHDRETNFGVLPYSDGSGNVFDVTVRTPRDGSEDEIVLKNAGSVLYLTVREWAYLRRAVDAGITHHLALGADLAQVEESDPPK